jgi:hypothetical protein
MGEAAVVDFLHRGAGDPGGIIAEDDRSGLGLLRRQRRDDQEADADATPLPFFSIARMPNGELLRAVDVELKTRATACRAESAA